jgi:hypothetical protein
MLDIKKRIFEKYVRLNKNKKGRISLGLSISIEFIPKQTKGPFSGSNQNLYNIT